MLCINALKGQQCTSIATVKLVCANMNHELSEDECMQKRVEGARPALQVMYTCTHVHATSTSPIKKHSPPLRGCISTCKAIPVMTHKKGHVDLHA